MAGPYSEDWDVNSSLRGGSQVQGEQSIWEEQGQRAVQASVWAKPVRRAQCLL